MRKSIIIFILILFSLTGKSQVKKYYVPWLEAQDITNDRYFIWRGDTIDFDFTNSLDSTYIALKTDTLIVGTDTLVVGGFVKPQDSTVVFVTPEQLRDTIATLAGGHDKLTLHSTATAGGLSLDAVLTQMLKYQQATSTQNGYLRAADFTLFYNKLSTVTHDSTLIGEGTVSIPLRVDTTRMATLYDLSQIDLTGDDWGAEVVRHDITLNGNGTVSSPMAVDTTMFVTQTDLSYTISLLPASHDAVTLGTANGLSLDGQELSLSQANSGTTGSLLYTDWIAFNAKMDSVHHDITLGGNGSSALDPMYVDTSLIATRNYAQDLVSSGANIYNTDGLLTGLRILGLNQFGLTISQGGDSVVNLFINNNAGMTSFMGSYIQDDEDPIVQGIMTKNDEGYDYRTSIENSTLNATSSIDLTDYTILLYNTPYSYEYESSYEISGGDGTLQMHDFRIMNDEDPDLYFRLYVDSISTNIPYMYVNGEKVLTDGDSIITSGVNIYNSDGLLDGPRLVYLDGKYIEFIDTTNNNTIQNLRLTKENSYLASTDGTPSISIFNSQVSFGDPSISMSASKYEGRGSGIEAEVGENFSAVNLSTGTEEMFSSLILTDTSDVISGVRLSYNNEDFDYLNIYNDSIVTNLPFFINGNQVLTEGDITTIDNQDLSSNEIAGDSVRVYITNGDSTTFNISDSDADSTNELNTSVTWNPSTKILNIVDAGGTKGDTITGFLTAEQDKSITNEKNLSALYTPATRIFSITDSLGTVSDTLSLFSSTLPGLVPASTGGTTKYLRADGTWVIPSGTTYTANAGVKLRSGNFSTNIAGLTSMTPTTSSHYLIWENIGDSAKYKVDFLSLGDYRNWNASELAGTSIATTSPTNGQFLVYNSSTSKWTPTTYSPPTSQWTTDSYGITYSGNVGIGTGSYSSAKLDVRTNTSGSYTAFFMNPNSGGHGLYIAAGNSTNTSFQVANYSGGNLFTINGAGQIFANSLTNATKSNVLYYDSSTKEITYGTAPSGGGSLFTDGGTYTYLTSTSDNLFIGNNSTDVSTKFDVYQNTSTYWTANFRGGSSSRGVRIRAGSISGTNNALDISDYSNTYGLFKVGTNGAIKMPQYGSGDFTGTAAKWLAVTSTGDVIEEDAPSGSFSYPGSGIARSTGTAWATSISIGTDTTKYLRNNGTWGRIDPFLGLSIASGYINLDDEIIIKNNISSELYRYKAKYIRTGNVHSIYKTAPEVGENVFAGISDNVIILSNSSDYVTLPSSDLYDGITYIIVNRTSSSLTISSYQAISGSASTSIPAHTSITIVYYVEDELWYQIH